MLHSLNMGTEILMLYYFLFFPEIFKQFKNKTKNARQPKLGAIILPYLLLDISKYI